MQYHALMDDETTALATAIGDRVGQLRRSRRWTLDQLAAVSGVSRRMLVNVEQGAANPSVGILLRISGALGVGLPALVEPPAGPALRVTRSGTGPALWTGAAGGRGVLVAGSAPPDVLELWDWSLAPGDQHDSEPHTAGTTEALQVREGALNLTVGDQTVILETGDAISFPGDLPHSYSTAHDAPARFTLAVFEPGVGATPRLEIDHA